MSKPIGYNPTMKKLYTTRGDDGTTGLLGDRRVPKNDPRIRAVGALDEASAALGLARSLMDDQVVSQVIKTIQLDLYQIMSLVVLEKSDPIKFPDLQPERTSWLEENIAQFEDSVNTPKGFILPGDSLPSAAFGVARTIIRRAEREVVDLNQQGLLLSESILAYLNRLSSLCYTLELYTAQHLPSPTGYTP